MFGDGNDGNATSTSPGATTRFVSVSVVPHDEENLSISKRRGLDYRGYCLRKKGIARSKCDRFEFATGCAVLVVTEIRNDVDKS